MNPILAEDIKSFELPDELVGALAGSTIMLTGSTGLIGSAVVRCLCALNVGIRFVLPVRNAGKCREMFTDESDHITVVQTDLADFFAKTDLRCDFILHCASPTDGDYIAQHPVETFMLAVESTRRMLEYARHHSVKGLVFVSSVEYYGKIYDDSPVTEDMTGQIDHTSARSSYPLGKQAAEYLCVSYAGEYGVPVMIARPTQVFGAGIATDDRRVFAQFARSTIENRDIILHTTGESAKPYCYTTDAVAALVCIMLKGMPGEAYNIATPDTYVSIRRLAELFKLYFNNNISIQIDLGGSHNYAPTTKVNLDSSKLRHLGWTPRYGLPEMLRRLIEYLKSANNK